MSDLPVMNSEFPPSRETVEGQTMVLVAASLESREDIVEQLEDLLEEADDAFPDVANPPAPEDAEALVERVVIEHNRVVTETSEHARAIADVLATCYESGLYPSWCEAENGTDAWMDAHDILGDALRGIVVATIDDVTEMLTDQRLRLWVGALEEDHQQGVLDEVVALVRDHGLPVDESRAGEGWLVLAPVRYEAVFEDEELEG